MSQTILNKALRMLQIYRGIPMLDLVDAVAEAANVSRRTVFYWRAGKSGPDAGQAAAIREVLNRFNERSAYRQIKYILSVVDASIPEAATAPELLETLKSAHYEI